ncbi:MAG: hypothetical protein B6U72_05615 [Candidatus Altiarchaeales archaeon ex4484_2]|nr:MAG: hypothetical protein B6U72_05615 [Candidatus Altiarchaeales archaeon ex4484_2]
MDHSETNRKAHETNIRRLIDEFGESRGDRIRRVYENAKEAAEVKARVGDFTPIFIYREVRSMLKSMGTWR